MVRGASPGEHPGVTDDAEVLSLPRQLGQRIDRRVREHERAVPGHPGVATGERFGRPVADRFDAGPDKPEFKGRSMWWKTGARRLEPWVPTSAQYRKEVARAEAEAQRVSVPHTPLGAVVPPSRDVMEAEVVHDATDWPEPAEIPHSEPDAER